MITYDDRGDYGHPDHITAHRVTKAAVDAAAGPGERPGWTVAKFYWIATPARELAAGFADVAADPAIPFATAPLDTLGMGVADDAITTVLDASDHVAAKRAALAAHATQIDLAGGFFALSNHLGRRISGVEHYRLIRGTPGGALDATGHETDLFGGLDA